LRMLWVVATNPAVSLPELGRIRQLLSQHNLFLVCQDAFLTETANLADVVLPAAMWGEKTGCFTNADRTVHISHKAIQPPGDARSDLDIFLDYARRMDFRDKDNVPLIKWRDPESAFEAFKDVTRGQPCDYSGLTYGRGYMPTASLILHPRFVSCTGTTSPPERQRHRRITRHTILVAEPSLKLQITRLRPRYQTPNIRSC
jgi:anaerobic selenocysteine-containing dehydrogenase